LIPPLAIKSGLSNFQNQCPLGVALTRWDRSPKTTFEE